MCIRDRSYGTKLADSTEMTTPAQGIPIRMPTRHKLLIVEAVSYTHLRAHETVLDLVCRLLLEKKKHQR